MLLLRSFMFPALSFESFAHFPLIEIRHLRHFIFTSWSVGRRAQVPSRCSWEDRCVRCSSVFISGWNWIWMSCIVACNGSHEAAWLALQMCSRTHHSWWARFCWISLLLILIQTFAYVLLVAGSSLYYRELSIDELPGLTSTSRLATALAACSLLDMPVNFIAPAFGFQKNFPFPDGEELKRRVRRV